MKSLAPKPMGFRLGRKDRNRWKIYIGYFTCSKRKGGWLRSRWSCWRGGGRRFGLFRLALIAGEPRRHGVGLQQPCGAARIVIAEAFGPRKRPGRAPTRRARRRYPPHCKPIRPGKCAAANNARTPVACPAACASCRSTATRRSGLRTIGEAPRIPKREMRQAYEHDQTRCVGFSRSQSGDADQNKQARERSQIVDFEERIEIDAQREQQQCRPPTKIEARGG